MRVGEKSVYSSSKMLVCKIGVEIIQVIEEQDKELLFVIG